jgi:hypothetical protein
VFKIYCLNSFVVFAQSNDKISEILQSEKVSYGEVCYIVASAQGFISDDASYEQAIQTLYDKGQIKTLVYKDELIPLVNIAYVYSQIWKVKGGIMCRVTKGSPRYVFKQLKTDGVIDKSKDPSFFISGREALSLYTSCAYHYGNQFIEIE